MPHKQCAPVFYDASGAEFVPVRVRVGDKSMPFNERLSAIVLKAINKVNKA